jgi:hypothetical protein
MSSWVLFLGPAHARECIDKGTKRCRHTTHYRSLFRSLPYLSIRSCSSVRPPSTHLLFPPPLFFLSICVIPHLDAPLDWGSFVLARGVGPGSVTATTAECSSGGGGAAALDVGLEGRALLMELV